jgi:hypothetical protein
MLLRQSLVQSSGNAVERSVAIFRESTLRGDVIQLNKPLLGMEKRVNQDHEHVPEKQARDLLSRWAWLNLGRGRVFTVAFACGVVGLAV